MSKSQKELLLGVSCPFLPFSFSHYFLSAFFLFFSFFFSFFPSCIPLCIPLNVWVGCITSRATGKHYKPPLYSIGICDLSSSTGSPQPHLPPWLLRQPQKDTEVGTRCCNNLTACYNALGAFNDIFQVALPGANTNLVFLNLTFSSICSLAPLACQLNAKSLQMNLTSSAHCARTPQKHICP